MSPRDAISFELNKARKNLKNELIDFNIFDDILLNENYRAELKVDPKLHRKFAQLYEDSLQLAIDQEVAYSRHLFATPNAEEFRKALLDGSTLFTDKFNVSLNSLFPKIKAELAHYIKQNENDNEALQAFSHYSVYPNNLGLSIRLDMLTANFTKRCLIRERSIKILKGCMTQNDFNSVSGRYYGIKNAAIDRLNEDQYLSKSSQRTLNKTKTFLTEKRDRRQRHIHEKSKKSVSFAPIPIITPYKEAITKIGSRKYNNEVAKKTREDILKNVDALLPHIMTLLPTFSQLNKLKGDELVALKEFDKDYDKKAKKSKQKITNRRASLEEVRGSWSNQQEELKKQLEDKQKLLALSKEENNLITITLDILKKHAELTNANEVREKIIFEVKKSLFHIEEELNKLENQLNATFEPLLQIREKSENRLVPLRRDYPEYSDDVLLDRLDASQHNLSEVNREKTLDDFSSDAICHALSLEIKPPSKQHEQQAQETKLGPSSQDIKVWNEIQALNSKAPKVKKAKSSKMVVNSSDKKLTDAPRVRFNSAPPAFIKSPLDEIKFDNESQLTIENEIPVIEKEVEALNIKHDVEENIHSNENPVLEKEADVLNAKPEVEENIHYSEQELTEAEEKFIEAENKRRRSESFSERLNFFKQKENTTPTGTPRSPILRVASSPKDGGYPLTTRAASWTHLDPSPSNESVVRRVSLSSPRLGSITGLTHEDLDRINQQPPLSSTSATEETLPLTPKNIIQQINLQNQLASAQEPRSPRSRSQSHPVNSTSFAQQSNAMSTSSGVYSGLKLNLHDVQNQFGEKGENRQSTPGRLAKSNLSKRIDQQQGKSKSVKDLKSGISLSPHSSHSSGTISARSARPKMSARVASVASLFKREDARPVASSSTPMTHKKEEKKASTPRNRNALGKK